MAADYTISEAAAAAGCTPEEIRAWGQRYGWPRPRRSAAGYRLFSDGLVSVLRRVVACRDGGTPISAIIGTGVPLLPDVPVVRPTPIDLSGLPEATRQEGRDLLSLLRSSVGRLAPAEVRHVGEARLSRVHPADRPAVLALLDRVDPPQAGAA